MFDPSQLSPELLQRLLSLGTMDEQDAMLQEQLAQAEALAKPQGGYSTPTGAALGGLGNLLNGLTSKRKQGEIGRKREDLLKQKQALRSEFGGLFGFGARPVAPVYPDGGTAAPAAGGAAPSPFDNLRPATPFGYGGRYGYIPGGY